MIENPNQQEETQVLIEQYNIQNSQQQIVLPIIILNFNLSFPILPIQNPPKDIPIIQNPKDIPRQRSRSRTPRKEVSRLSECEINHYTFEILKAFQSAEQRRIQLQNKNI